MDPCTLIEDTLVHTVYRLDIQYMLGVWTVCILAKNYVHVLGLRGVLSERVVGGIW